MKYSEKNEFIKERWLPLLNFEGDPGVPLLNFKGVPGSWSHVYTMPFMIAYL